MPAALPPADAERLDARLRSSLSLDEALGDTLTVVVDTPARGAYAARNRGARGGRAPWLLFLDADVRPRPGLLEALFEPQPGPRCGLLAGAVHDAPGTGAVAGWAVARRSMDQARTLDGPAGFAQTANLAVRRDAWRAVGGFADVRSGGDADLCLRVRAAGWSLEPRRAAAVDHVSRERLGALLRQRARHGAGAAWLERRRPGTAPARRWLGLARWALRRCARAAALRVRGRRDEAAWLVIDALATWAFELGRLAPNTPPRRRRARRWR